MGAAGEALEPHSGNDLTTEEKKNGVVCDMASWLRPGDTQLDKCIAGNNCCYNEASTLCSTCPLTKGGGFAAMTNNGYVEAWGGSLPPGFTWNIIDGEPSGFNEPQLG